MKKPSEYSPYEQLGGDAAVRKLVDRFYDLMDERKDAISIRAMHPNDLADSRDKLYEFLSGFFGGPPLYHQNRGHPKLRMRHLPFSIDEAARDAWLACMHQALEEQVDDQLLLMQLKTNFHKTAHHLINQKSDADMSEPTFILHPQLESDSTFITDLSLCSVRLINDSNYPWVVLVPRREGAIEVYKLDQADQQQLTLESEALCKAMEALFKPDKMNVAALGNMVPQLHIHHIARFKTDSAWPAPIWGVTHSTPYDQEAMQQRIKSIKDKL